MIPTLALPGSLDRVSGGTLYDRHVLTGLRKQGLPVAALELPSGFPCPTRDEMETSLRALARAAEKGPVIVDGLALGALGGDIACAVPKERLIALVHHPIADEGGMTARQRNTFLESERAALHQAGVIVAPSRVTADRIRTLFGPLKAPIHAIPPGVAPSVGQMNLSLVRPGRPWRLLGLGSLTQRKRWPLLLQALSRISAPWRLDLAGPADADPGEARRTRAALRRLGLGERVRILGTLPPDRISRLWRRADLLVHPSAYEGYGMVLAEAAAHGRPVICTSGGGTVDAVARNAGLIVSPDDCHELAASLSLFFGRRTLRRQLMQAARAASRTPRTWDRVAAEWLLLLTP